jgi:hypothetical protein
MSRTPSGPYVLDGVPELFEDMTRSDIVYVLQRLSFSKRNIVTIKLDRPVRDYLVSRLSDRR